MRRFKKLLVGATMSLASGAFLQCGARTGLLVPELDAAAPIDACVLQPVPMDAGWDAARGDASPACRTTVSGVVRDPGGRNPLYNIVVWQPNGELSPFPPPNTTCDTCGALFTSTGTSSTRSNVRGEFRLDVPSGSDVPIVIQIGRWRRQVRIPQVPACEDTKLDADLTRLPRTSAEGDLPQIALVTGGLDPVECLLRKIGIADSEFTNNSGSGRVHVYRQSNGARLASGTTQSAPVLWRDPKELAKHDLVLLGCEGSEPYNADPTRSDAPASLQAITDYLNGGGRVFATHYHYFWFENAPGDIRKTATYGDNVGRDGTLRGQYTIDTSFAKGRAFAEWLSIVGATKKYATIELDDVRNDVRDVNMDLAVNRWIYSGSSPKYITFRTPVGKPLEEQCGLAAFSDLHVASRDKPGQEFPRGCLTSELSPQELALEFLLFDLSACVQDQAPEPCQ